MRVRASGYEWRDRTALPDAGVGWLQGLGATLIRNVPANSVYLGSFEVMKREVAQRQDVPVSQLHPGALSSDLIFLIIHLKTLTNKLVHHI